MGSPRSLELGMKWFNEDFAALPHAEEVLAKWQGLLENQRFLAHVRIIKEFQKDLDPIPNRDHHEELIRRTGHEFAAVEVLPRGTNYIRLVLGSFCVRHHNYLALHGTLAALLLDRRRAMTDGEVALLYSSMDRLLRGGLEWKNVTHVAAANKEFYRALRAVKWPLSSDVTTALREIIQTISEALFAGDSKAVLVMMAATCNMLAAAACLRRGGTTVSPSHSKVVRRTLACSTPTCVLYHWSSVKGGPDTNQHSVAGQSTSPLD